jgi:isorenieratene synthase
VIVVIGSGLAGLSAALHIAEGGVPVTVVEAHPAFFGGRTRSREGYRFAWNGVTHTQPLDHGQHCIWFQYYNMRRLLVRLGLWDSNVRECTTTQYIVDEGYESEEVMRLPPLDVQPSKIAKNRLQFLRSLARAAGAGIPSIGDIGRLARALPRLAQVATFRHGSDYRRWDDVSVAQMFAWLGLPEGMDRVLKSLCKASTFHPHTETSAAWGLSMIESTLLHHPADHKMWCFRGSLGRSLIDPLVAAIEARGGRVLRNAKAVDLDFVDGRIQAVHLAPTAPASSLPSSASSRSPGGTALAEPTVIACQAVVSATDIPGFQELMLPRFGHLPEVRAAANLETVSNATIRVVTSRRVREGEPWMGIFSGRFHWLDCYFLLSRYQDELMAWSAVTGGDVIEFHSYFAQREIAGCRPEILRQNIEKEVIRTWPELAGNIVHIEHFINERTFDKQTVGHHNFAPPMNTSIPNLTLCGSWPRVDTAVHDMEKAVFTGIVAANRILSELARPLVPPIPLRPHRTSSVAVRLASRLLPSPPGVIP